jgi:hypothetical protein
VGIWFIPNGPGCDDLVFRYWAWSCSPGFYLLYFGCGHLLLTSDLVTGTWHYIMDLVIGTWFLFTGFVCGNLVLHTGIGGGDPVFTCWIWSWGLGFYLLELAAGTRFSQRLGYYLLDLVMGDLILFTGLGHCKLVLLSGLACRDLVFI